MKSSLVITLCIGLTQLSAYAAPYVVYMDQCTEVARKPLTAEQQTAWQELQVAEQRMAFLQQPLDEMQQKLTGPQDKLQQLTDGKSMMDSQQIEHYSAEVESIINIYQKDIDRVNEFSKEITGKAERFSTLIASTAPTAPYQQVQIVAQEQDKVNCDQNVLLNAKAASQAK